MASVVQTVSSAELPYMEGESIGSSFFNYEDFMCDVPLDKLKEMANGSDKVLDQLKINTSMCFNIGTCPMAMYNATGQELIEYLVHLLGEPHYSYSFIIPFVVILGLLVTIGFLGNLFTIIVIFRNRVLQTSSHYLVSMAFSDLLILSLTGPTEIAFALSAWPWVYSDFLCRVRYYLIEACTYTTVLHITAFTVERYIAICHPIKAKSLVTKSRATKIIISIWFFSFTVCLPLFIAYHTWEVCPGIPESMFCHVQDTIWNKRVDNFYRFSLTVLFLIPMTVISILYSLIARVLYGSNIQVKMRRSSRTTTNKIRTKKNGSIPDETHQKAEDSVEKTRRQIVKMLALVALCFAICWLPFHIIRLMPSFNYDNWSDTMLNIYHKGLYHISIVLLYTSSTINPILYNVMSARFRQAFRRTILCQDYKNCCGQCFQGDEADAQGRPLASRCSVGVTMYSAGATQI
ncbi:growth hormone secretagogue receptor type 1-like isoform X2 [Amphiura filiformis]|uniref:growth hormone secretagogue receptor type 1-like isoform X2 n=1 Tax=Amphiura filiformis TaxID=82378 RepID=UPI003B218713